MAQILDYSAGYPGAINVRRLGFDGVLRYLRKEGASNVRPLTVAEVADMTAFDRTLALIYQHVSKSRVLEGRAAGRHDAAWALARARECGIEPRCIYFAVDFDTISAGQWAAVREYMLGAGEVIGVERVGTYGEYDLLEYLFARASITWGWQTYAWSTGHNKDNQPRHPRAHLFQRLGLVTVGGISCDVNDILKPDYGQTPYEGEFDMTPQELQAAVRVGVLDALKDWGYYRYEDGRNLVDDEKQQTASGVSANTQLDQVITLLANIVEKLPVAPGAPADLAALADAVNDEADRRGRDGDPATGRPS